MAEFSGIRNENEFYFAHYLTSLMDDELKEVCQTDEMKSAFEKVSKLGLEYHAVAAARDLVNRHRWTARTISKSCMSLSQNLPDAWAMRASSRRRESAFSRA